MLVTFWILTWISVLNKHRKFQVYSSASSTEEDSN